MDESGIAINCNGLGSEGESAMLTEEKWERGKDKPCLDVVHWEGMKKRNDEKGKERKEKERKIEEHS